MKRKTMLFLGSGALAMGVVFAVVRLGGAAQEPEWSMNASVIEACSCPMFCQCYFNDHPAGGPGHGDHADHAAQQGAGHEGHEGKHFCRANNAYRVNHGHYASTKLDGAKFWVAADLGDNFADGEMDWAVATFDKSTSKEQREGITAILARLFPVKWKSLTTGEGAIEWTPGDDVAKATLDGGKTAEVVLKKRTSSSDDATQPTVIRNLKYWGASRNDGFVLMPNEVEAWRVGDRKFEYNHTNGFMLTFDVDSKTAPPAAAASGG